MDNNNNTGPSITEWLIIFGIAILIACWVNGCSDSGNSSQWDSLTKEEKEWYHRNYGNGKAEAINKAITNYRGY